MKSLSKLINEFGEPSALVDSWDKQLNRFAIWGFEDIFVRYINDSPLMLEEWQTILDKWKRNTNHKDICAIGGFSYDLRTVIFPHIQFKNVF